ncbi:hypothetical protein EDM56_28465 [Brevibacillus fluminis]|uniref:Uncharacterized protein n=1 Tax=Brevibacillus fluminis TaxID=511487 RepID=A0A3M8CVV1_9BACL|nr:ABC-three component system middle component 4 [Brevibacillus fluminis]RNB79748.1 hypothetical protein EDM56_28465 [Brevibacillus fluminis]
MEHKINNKFIQALMNSKVQMEVEPIENQILYVKPDDDYDFHTYRLLLLINVCGLVVESVSTTPLLYGRSKFAFYDFLIRYPFYLEKVINNSKKKKLSDKLNLNDYEKVDAFSPMINYLRGPWDPRYDSIFNYMVSKNLIQIKYTKITPSGDKQFCIILTDLGMEISNEVHEIEGKWVHRMEIINEIFPKKSTNARIDKYIAEFFPELILGGGNDVY